MNRIYRLIWSDKAGTFVAVAEIVKSGKKSSGESVVGSSGSRFLLKGLAVTLMLAFASNAYALPNGGNVTAGGATITSTATSTTINQSTANAAINWQGFSIGQGEAVQFVQPSSSSITLNRVLGPDPSSIMGNLSANGKVFLLNPNGILFGQGAQVNVGGLVASTLSLSDSDFMAGRYQFSGAGTGAILNQGSINADGGYVALLGANVSNQGVISARLGTVTLAAGNAVTLDVAGDGLLNVTVNQGAVNALVENGGLIQADGGQVLLTAMAAGSLLQSAVNNTGVIQAQTIENHNGTIKLMGDMQIGTVNVGGTLDASAPNGGNGGFIETSAANVNIANDAIITTAAPTGLTGTWLIDPADFNIALVGGDITGFTLTGLLVNNNVTISTVVTGVDTPTSFFAVPGQGDINVNDKIGVGSGALWTAAGAPTTLTLNSARDVNINSSITATKGNLVVCCGRDVNVKEAITTTNGSILLSAGQDVNIVRSGANPATAITTTDGNIKICAGRNVNLDNTLDGAALMTLTTGSVVAGEDLADLGVTRGLTLSAGTASTGPGAAGGTVIISPGTYITTTGPDPVTPTNIFYNPTSYLTPTDYSTFFTGNGSPLTQYMLVFPSGADKTYDGTTTATPTGLKGTPAGVTLAGAGTATFDTADAGTDKIINFSGFTLAQGATQTGGLGINFALPVTCCAPVVSRTTADITPLALIGAITAANKVYDTTTTATITSRTLTGVLGADVVTYTGGTASFATPAVGIGKTVTGTGLALGGADAGNYTVNTDPTTTAAITAVPPVVPPVVIPPIVPSVVVPLIVSPVLVQPVAPVTDVPLVVSPILVMPVTAQIGVPAWTPQVSFQTSPPQLTEAQFMPPPVAPAPIAVPVEPIPIVIPAPVEPVPVIVPQERAPESFVPVLRPRKADRN